MQKASKIKANVVQQAIYLISIYILINNDSIFKKVFVVTVLVELHKVHAIY